MRDDAPSRTAAFVAAARQLGQLLPDDARLIDDPYGAAFTSTRAAALLEREAPRLAAVASLPGIKQWVLYMQVRTRIIDDALRDFLASGGRQVVLLGAGYDCRALRMPELADANIFEVDHPATQSHKKRVLDDLGTDSPVTYVTWDFEARPLDDLPEHLGDSGLDRADPVFTIWEGVTMYLTDAAIDASLRAIRAWSYKGSQLAMTYFAKSRIAQPSLITRAMKAVVGAFGEPWKFGWQPDELPAYLAERNWELVRDVSMADAAQRLLPARFAASLVDPDKRFALAAAPESLAVAR
jgi:methyltransferase (TIGR00027 family)